MCSCLQRDLHQRYKEDFAYWLQKVSHALNMKWGVAAGSITELLSMAGLMS